MRNILTILFLLFCFCAHAQLIKFSELPAASTLGGTEIVPGVQAGANRKISMNQIKAFVWDLSPTITTSDTIGFVFVRRTSDGKIFKRSVSSIRHIFEDEGTPLAATPPKNSLVLDGGKFSD